MSRRSDDGVAVGPDVVLDNRAKKASRAFVWFAVGPASAMDEWADV
jgi:hypothetical protein